MPSQASLGRALNLEEVEPRSGDRLEGSLELPPLEPFSHRFLPRNELITCVGSETLPAKRGATSGFVRCERDPSDRRDGRGDVRGEIGRGEIGCGTGGSEISEAWRRDNLPLGRISVQLL